MIIRTIAILGGTGFVGTHLANRLARAGYRLRVLTRRRERSKHLLVIPTLTLVQADVHDPAVLERELAGCDAAVNLVGILNERGDDGRGFRAAHVELTARLLEACRRNGVRRLLHMSALNADPAGPSHYLRSKGEAEALVHAAHGEQLAVTSFRPSVIFGPEDQLFNRFAGLLRLSPGVFPLACPQARFAPVYVGDVAGAFARALDLAAAAGARYELCGPHVYTLRRIVEYTRDLLGLRRLILALPDAAARLQARLAELAPGKPFSRDNYRSLQVDSVCGADAGLARLGIEPTPVEAIVPRYIHPPRPGGRYGGLRRMTGRLAR